MHLSRFFFLVYVSWCGREAHSCHVTTGLSVSTCGTSKCQTTAVAADASCVGWARPSARSWEPARVSLLSIFLRCHSCRAGSLQSTFQDICPCKCRSFARIPAALRFECTLSAGFEFHRNIELSETEGRGCKHCWARQITATSSTPPIPLSLARPSETARKPVRLSLETDQSAHVFQGAVAPVKGCRPGRK